MAFLIPQNIPSRNDLPGRLQKVASALRDFLPNQVTVWLERPEGGDSAAIALDFKFDLDEDPSPSNAEPYLVLFDPAAGIAVLEAPSPSSLRLGGRWRLRRPRVDLSLIRSETEQRMAELGGGLAATSQSQIRSLPMRRVIALPDLSRIEVSDVSNNGAALLTKEDFEEPNLRGSLHRILRSDRPNLTHHSQEAVRAVINPRIVIGDRSSKKNQGVLFDPPLLTDPSQSIAVLDRRQERLAMALGPGYRLIRGVAGSGKTLILTYRARYLSEHFPSSRILLLCYNRPLSVALDREVKAHRNITAINIDRMAVRLLQRSGADKGNLKTDEQWREMRKKAAEVARDLSHSKKFDVVLVDEAQDLETSHLDLAYAMLKSGKDNFIMALDSAQNIYRRRMTWNPPGLTARGRTTILRRNYRNTREILDSAFGLSFGYDRKEDPRTAPSDLNALVMPEAAERSGEPPLLLECKDVQSEALEIARIVKKLCDRGTKRKDIVVLSGSNEFREQMRLSLNRVGVPWLDAQKNRDRAALVQDKVRIATLHLLKGLEFPHVILGGANHVWVRESDGVGKIEAQKRLLYVAMTRATKTLTVTYSGEGPITDALQTVRGTV